MGIGACHGQGALSDGLDCAFQGNQINLEKKEKVSSCGPSCGPGRAGSIRGALASTLLGSTPASSIHWESLMTAVRLLQVVGRVGGWHQG